MVIARASRQLLLGALLGLGACSFPLANNSSAYSCAGDSLCPPGETCGSDQLCHAADAGVDAGFDAGCAVACAQGERCIQAACVCDATTCTGGSSCNGANRCVQGRCISGGNDCNSGNVDCCSAVCDQKCNSCGGVGATCGNGSGGGGGGCCTGLGCDPTFHCAACQGEGAPCNVADDCCRKICTDGHCAMLPLCDSNCGGCNSGNCVCPLGDRCGSISSCHSLNWQGSCQ